MKVLLRTLDAGSPLPRFRAFEGLLTRCLADLGHEVVALPLAVLTPEPPDVAFRIYAHQTRRQVPSADLFYKEMYMPGLFTIDHLGWGGDHSAAHAAPDLSSISLATAESFCAGLRREFLASGHSKHPQPPFAQLNAALQPFLLAPLQTPGDDAIVHQSSLDVIEYIHLLADWAERRRFRIVFKVHPTLGSEPFETAVVETLQTRLASARYAMALNENIHSLIAASAGVVVLNSGVGFESLIHGKPVVTLGACDYRWATYGASPASLDAALQYVQQYSEEQRQRVWQFIYYYYFCRSYSMDEGHVQNSSDRLFRYLARATSPEASASTSSNQVSSLG